MGLVGGRSGWGTSPAFCDRRSFGQFRWMGQTPKDVSASAGWLCSPAGEALCLGFQDLPGSPLAQAAKPLYG